MILVVKNLSGKYKTKLRIILHQIALKVSI